MEQAKATHQEVTQLAWIQSPTIGSEWRCTQECGVSLKSGAYPVPVIPVNDMPELARVLNASYAVHDALQHAFHTTFVLGRR